MEWEKNEKMFCDIKNWEIYEGTVTLSGASEHLEVIQSKNPCFKIGLARKKGLEINVT